MSIIEIELIENIAELVSASMKKLKTAKADRYINAAKMQMPKTKTPSVRYSSDVFTHNPFLVADKTDHRKLTLRTDTDREINVRNLEPGKDYCVWINPDNNGDTEIEILEKGLAVPSGRMIGGFHTLCKDVGDIDGHPLSGYKAGDILPNSVWCLNHRSAGLQDGTVYDPISDQWVMIYLSSGTGKDTRSAFGAKPTVQRNWYDFVDDALKVGGKLMTRAEFISAMNGSPNGTSIENYPDTTGGHTAEKGQRVISNIGCEDGTGVLWQWTADAGDNGSGNYDSNATGKGAAWTYSNGRDAHGLAGTAWVYGSLAGVLTWDSGNGSSVAYSDVGARLCFCALHFAE